MEAALTLSLEVGIKHACESLDVSRSGFYRMQARGNTPSVEPKKRPNSPRALSSDERQEVLDILHTDRFVDKAPMRSTQPFWTKANTVVPSAPCTAYSTPIKRSRNAGTN